MTNSEPSNEQSNANTKGIYLGSVKCPCCSTPMPKLHIPTDLHQMMWGGFTCPTCETTLDKWGEPVKLISEA